MVGRGFSSIFWGVIADRVGRKPVITFSILSVYVRIYHCTTDRHSEHVRRQIIYLSIYQKLIWISITDALYCRVVFSALFGLSTTYWMAIATRLVLGALNGLLAPIKVRFRCLSKNSSHLLD
jgi:MFS family permease